MRKVTWRHPGDGALDILLSASADGASLFLTSDGGQRHGRAEWPNALRWAACHAVGAGESSSGMVEPARSALPFDDDLFERVVLSVPNGWPMGSRERRLAGEIRRVLAPRGELLVIVPGRFGYRRFAEIVRPPARQGAVAERGRPRWQAGLRLLATWKHAPSRRTLARFLAEAGLAGSEWFHPRRDAYGGLVEVEPLSSSRNPWLAYRTPPGRNQLRRSPWLVDEYAVRAGPAALGESVVEQCLSAMAARLWNGDGSAPDPRIERYLVTAKEKVVVLLRLDETRMIMRIPLTAAALAGCQRNFAALRSIADDRERRGLAPLPLDNGIVRSGQYYTVESRMAGIPTVPNAGDASNLERVETLLQHLNPESKLRRARLEDDLYDRLVGQPLERVIAVLPEPDTGAWLARLFRDALEGQQVTLGISHGDFSLSNIHVHDGRACGLIDWDDSALEGLPIEDVISHLSSRLVRRSDGFARTLLGLATRDTLTMAEDRFLRRCYAHFGIDPALHPAFTLLFWIRVIDSQRDFAFASDASYRESRIERVTNAVIADPRFRAPLG